MRRDRERERDTIRNKRWKRDKLKFCKDAIRVQKSKACLIWDVFPVRRHDDIDQIHGIQSDMSVQRGSCTTGTGDGARSGNQLHVIYGSISGIRSLFHLSPISFIFVFSFLVGFSVCQNIEIHSRQRQTLLSVSSTNAIDFHWWCTTIRYNIDASHAWCTSRRSVCIRIWFYFIWFFSHPIRQTITMNCDDFCIGHVIDIHHFLDADRKQESFREYCSYDLIG